MCTSCSSNTVFTRRGPFSGELVDDGGGDGGVGCSDNWFAEGELPGATNCSFPSDLSTLLGST